MNANLHRQDYNGDIVAWANEQARFLRAGRFDLLDIEHLADEIEDVGKSERRELENRMAVLLAHLLKWQYQPTHRSRSWTDTIKLQRRAIERRLNKTSSLRQALSDHDWLESAWDDALNLASNKTSIAASNFPDICPWTAEQILGAWFPE